MEPVVFDETPLADYLKAGGEDSESEWASAGGVSSRDSSVRDDNSPQLSPIPTFAPNGRPVLKARFRSHIPKALRLGGSGPTPLQSFHRTCSAAVAAGIDGGDNDRFLEQFRYSIVASQLLSAHSVPGLPQPNFEIDASATATTNNLTLSAAGVITSIIGALSAVGIAGLAAGRAPAYVTWPRVLLLLASLGVSVLLGQVFVRRRWLRYSRQQSLSELKAFVSRAQEFDRASGAALGLIQEVELVSRGYRISTPLPPISRLEDRSQVRRCVRLRKALHGSFSSILESYSQVSNLVKGLSEQTELEKYYDIYDISDFDISDTLQAGDDAEFEDPESLRALKIVAARFHTMRKMFLCALLALEANGDYSDIQRWSSAVEALQTINDATTKAYEMIDSILSEEDAPPTPASSKAPLTPGRERWRSSLRKINSLTTGIRGLQAKLQLLREESDHALNSSNDLSELGPTLLSQYESIGNDLKDLMASWEEGKAAVAHGIDRNEKRLSTASTLLSASSLSLSGLATVEEGGNVDDALRALTGASPTPSVINGELEEVHSPEVFEAVALPRARSTLTREERIVKAREDREHKAQARQQMDATKGMLRELETVINLRPRQRTSIPLNMPTRVASL